MCKIPLEANSKVWGRSEEQKTAFIWGDSGNMPLILCIFLNNRYRKKAYLVKSTR